METQNFLDKTMRFQVTTWIMSRLASSCPWGPKLALGMYIAAVIYRCAFIKFKDRKWGHNSRLIGCVLCYMLSFWGDSVTELEISWNRRNKEYLERFTNRPQVNIRVVFHDGLHLLTTLSFGRCELVLSMPMTWDRKEMRERNPALLLICRAQGFRA